MWILKWIFWVIVLFIIIIFVTQNVNFLNQKFVLGFLFWETRYPLPIWVVMFLSFAIGVLIWLIGSIFKLLELKSEVRKVNKENTALKKELNELRNMPLDEDSDSIDDYEKEIL
jgi:uncharacterized integral membrane protein